MTEKEPFDSFASRLKGKLENNGLRRHFENFPRRKVLNEKSNLDSCASTDKQIKTENIVQFNRMITNLETHQLVWLNQLNNKLTLNELRQIVDYTKEFNNVDACLQYLEDVTCFDTFLICSREFYQRLLSLYDSVDHIRGIYLMDDSENTNDEASVDHKQVKCCSHEVKDILDQLTTDVTYYLEKLKNGIFGSCFKENSLDTNAFAWCQHVVDFLCRIDHPTDSIHRLVQTLKEYYKGKQSILVRLDDFERNYEPSKAIWWYTRPIFLYQLLNRALRQYNIALIFLFGFYLKDLYAQLMNCHETFKRDFAESPILTVYRGQIIHKSEINGRAGMSEIINNSLFSTSLDRSVSIDFLKSSTIPNENFIPILFEIKIDIDVSARPFGDVSAFSAIPTEHEVLFMAGTTFDNTSIEYNEVEQIWISKLKLIHDFSYSGTTDPRHVTKIKRRLLKEQLSALVALLFCSSFENADHIFKQINLLYPSEEPWILGFKHICIGKIYHLNYSDMTNSLIYKNKALRCFHKYKNDHELNLFDDIGQIHSDMAELYRDMEDTVKALEHLQMAYVSYEMASKNIKLTNSEQNRFLYRIVKVGQQKIYVDPDCKMKIGHLCIKHQRTYIQNTLEHDKGNNCAVGSVFQTLGELQEIVEDYNGCLTSYEYALSVYLKENMEDLTYYIQQVIDSIVKVYSSILNDFDSALPRSKITSRKR